MLFILYMDCMCVLYVCTTTKKKKKKKKKKKSFFVSFCLRFGCLTAQVAIVVVFVPQKKWVLLCYF